MSFWMLPVHCLKCRRMIWDTWMNPAERDMCPHYMMMGKQPKEIQQGA